MFDGQNFVFIANFASMITELIPCLLISSVEIYVLAAVLAAGVIAWFVRPSNREAAREHLLAGTLCMVPGASPEPAIHIECLPDGNVLLTRCGLPPMTDGGAVSLAVSIIGFDVAIEERIVAAPGAGEPVNTALFTLDFLGHERYHLRYNSEPTATAASFTLSNRDGMSLVKPLKVNS